MFDYNNLKNLIVPTNFGPDNYGEETDSMRDIFEQLPCEVETHWGATQFVIIDPEQEKVAKIGFSGEYYYLDEDENFEEDPIYEAYDNDYAFISWDLFQQAEDEHIDILFAKIELFGETATGNTIYLQEKVIAYDYFDDSFSTKTSEHSKDSYRRLLSKDPYSGIKMFPIDWATAVIEWYGEELLKAFLKFIRDHKLDDFHWGNIGWRKDGSPCVLDWAGFDEGH